MGAVRTYKPPLRAGSPPLYGAAALALPAYCLGLIKEAFILVVWGDMGIWGYGSHIWGGGIREG